MAWVVELLDDRVREELESLSPDMQARFRKIVELIQGYAPGRRIVGNARAGQGRNIKGRLRDCQGAARRRSPSVRQEDAEDAQAGNRNRVGKSPGGTGPMKRTTVDDLHNKWMKNPKYRREYEALEEEFSLAAALIEARARAGLTQEQVARRMKTTQAVIARLEGGGSMPSTRTLEKYAKATGTRLKISFEPEATSSKV